MFCVSEDSCLRVSHLAVPWAYINLALLTRDEASYPHSLGYSSRFTHFFHFVFLVSPHSPCLACCFRLMVGVLLDKSVFSHFYLISFSSELLYVFFTSLFHTHTHYQVKFESNNHSFLCLSFLYNSCHLLDLYVFSSYIFIPIYYHLCFHVLIISFIPAMFFDLFQIDRPTHVYHFVSYSSQKLCHYFS